MPRIIFFIGQKFNLSWFTFLHRFRWVVQAAGPDITKEGVSKETPSFNVTMFAAIGNYNYPSKGFVLLY